ncbi:hypothetical protein [uncultured Tissierella sp.]|uniref:hypothetical protein n=1 Tax=uncultured Tissierella sp. TaxID=448160 RepID=UPI0028043544|nr:hypothetical protein [uncultured Tissierella sp.]MDU5081218.1 hypothetical protein [Bacillota bacterium]
MFEIKNNVHEGDKRDKINKALHSLVEKLSSNLDISTLKEMIIPDDLVKEVMEFQNSKGLKVEITNNEHAVACAKTIAFFANNQLKNVIFVHKNIINSLFDQELSKSSINIIHHELCHIHDNHINYKYFENRFLGKYIGDISEVSTSHAHVLFSEYVAECLSAATKDYAKSLNDSLNLLNRMIKSNKSYIDKYLYQYRNDNNAIEYFKNIQIHSFELLRVMTDICSLLNQTEDLKSLELLMTMVDEVCKLQKFYTVFSQLGSELKFLYSKYPLKKIEDYEELANIVEICWKLMHLEIISDAHGIVLKID